MTNMNPTTGIRYTMFRADAVNSDLLHELLHSVGKDLSYEGAQTEEVARQSQEFQDALDKAAEFTSSQHLIEDLRDEFEPNLDNFDPMIDEPIIEGVYEGVHYRTSWLGGAQHLWVFESPLIGKFDLCSPCVPGACDGDSRNPQGHSGYDLPPDWMANHEELRAGSAAAWEEFKKEHEDEN